MAVKVGILGYGYMGKWHHNKISTMQGIEVVSACDIAPEKLDEARAKGLRTTEDRAAFLNDPEIDLVVITTPNQFHMPYSIEALRAGKTVMSEKPVTLTVAELDQILEVAKETGNTFTVHQNRRWDTDYMLVRKILQEGTIGKPVSIETRVLGERGVVFGWRADPEYGGGMLYDWGVHLIDQILMLYPEKKVKTVFAQLHKVLTPTVDDYFKIELVFEDGLTSHVEVGTFALQRLPRWFVYADNGTLKLDDFTGKTGGMARIREREDEEAFEKAEVTGASRTMAPLSPDRFENVPLPEAWEEPYALYEALIASVEGRGSVAVDPYTVRRTMQVVEAAFESSRLNQSLSVDI